MKRIILSKQADAALEGIFDYTLEQWGITQARKYKDRLNSGLKKLVANPNIGSPSAYKPERLRVYRVEKHLFVYETLELGIIIHAIYHPSMNVADRIKELLHQKAE